MMRSRILGIRLLLIALTLATGNRASAQTADSLQYDHGYLHYHEYGAKELPPVIILTGGPGNSYNQLEGLAEKLSPKYRSILLEQRGTGRSVPTPMDASTMTLRLVTADIQLLMDSLGLRKSIILGHSWGGMLAMNFAAEYPQSVEHLVLIAPGPHKDVRHGFEILIANRKHTRSYEEEQRLSELDGLVSRDKADAEESREYRMLMRRAYIFANPIPDEVFQRIDASSNRESAMVLLEDVYENYDVSTSLNNFRGPIDVITGRQDVVGFCTYELKQDIPRANVHWINDCGHFPMYEQPREFYKVLFEVLEEGGK